MSILPHGDMYSSKCHAPIRMSYNPIVVPRFLLINEWYITLIVFQPAHLLIALVVNSVLEMLTRVQHVKLIISYNRIAHVNQVC